MTSQLLSPEPNAREQRFFKLTLLITEIEVWTLFLPAKVNLLGQWTHAQYFVPASSNAMRDAQCMTQTCVLLMSLTQVRLLLFAFGFVQVAQS